MESGFIPAGGAGHGSMAAPLQPVVSQSGNVIRAPGLKRGKMEEAISDRRKTILFWIRRNEETGRDLTPHHRHLYQQATTAEQDVAIVAAHSANPFHSTALSAADHNIKLETVLGLTVNSNAALDCDPNTELVAYTAGCTVVLYNARKNRQTHVVNASRKSVTCVAFSPDGRYLATGECGHAPAVRVWDLQDPTASGAVQIAEFPGHTHGVSCVAFSTSSKYLVSVGSQHDMIVNVWEWRSNLKLASNKVSSRVKAVSFAENGNYFVTVGFRHVKFWYLEYSRSAKFKEPVPLMGRSAILGEQKDNEFCDVVCGRGASADSTYAITRGGLLCEFNSRRLLDKWVELRTPSANCMAVGSNYIFVGCAEGIVRCFAPDTLSYVTTLPRTHYLGVDVAQGTDISHMYNQPPNARYPDAIALTYDEHNHKLTCVYNDHSLYVWDVRDIKRVGKSHSALYHSACIWGVDLAPGALLTCSSDDTVRIWNLDRHGHQSNNVYSNDLTKVLYIDPELKFLKDLDLTASTDKDKSKTYDDKIGVRCVKVSPDGEHIASGDRSGNIYVHSYSRGTLLHTLEAHDAEVLCVEYSRSKVQLLASASRDRLIHIFQVDRGYQILQTLDDHSSSITAVRFLQSHNGLQMVSCGADKTILFRQLVTTQDGGYQFARGQNVSGRTTLYDMEIDAGGRHILTACQDRNVRVYNAANGRHTKTFRGTTAEDGTLIKVALDSSGIYLATSSTDKILSVYDYYSGECMATMYGHSEIVTGLRFTPDCSHLISASGDGCIFIWRVPHDMCVTMRARQQQQAIRQGKKISSSNGLSGLDSETDSHLGSPPREIPFDDSKTTPLMNDYALRIGRLPSWAKKSMGEEVGPGSTALPAAAPAAPARGKWATRVQPHDKRVDSDGSKDSSIDSGTDTRYFDKRRDQNNVKQRPKSLNLSQLQRVEALFNNFDAKMAKTYDILARSPRFEKVTINVAAPRTPDGRSRHHTDDSSLGSFKYEDQESTEHDGDVEDISDGERTSSSESRNRPTYYPGNTNDSASEFMVNAMDVEVLRASQRRTNKWKKDVRLELQNVTTSPSATPLHSDDDEVSTPSGDNADRNPLSGSCESIDTLGRRERYLKSAFDSLSGAEVEQQPARLSHSKSASSQHTRPTSVSSPSRPLDPTAQRRREELQRRILETRRQLDTVGFKSSLKSSQSTTDLSYMPEKDAHGRTMRGRPNSMASPSNNRTYGSFMPEDYNSLNSNFFDSLNPCQMVNPELNYKNPYAIPANLNHNIPQNYTNQTPYTQPHSNVNVPSNDRINSGVKPYGQPVMLKEQPKKQSQAFTIDMSVKPVQSKVFDRLFPNAQDLSKAPPKIPPRNFNLNLNKDIQRNDKPEVNRKAKPNAARSIFKNYKSCPVSPVSEECKWTDKSVNSKNVGSDKINKTNTSDTHKRNSLSFFIGIDEATSEVNSQSIVNTIKSDTEKMIAEITEKYGDLDDFDDDLDYRPTKDIPYDEDGNFSSDSLEDCSLSQDASCKNKLYSKKVCKKHSKNNITLPRRAVSNYEISGLVEKPLLPPKYVIDANTRSSTLPRNMPSNLGEIIDEDYNINNNFTNMYRCQSVLTKRCVTRSNESVLSDNSNGSSVSNEIFMKYGNEVGFQQAKYIDNRYEDLNDSQNCSSENLNDLEKHRYSSASFFLNQRKYMRSSASQESVLSDDMFSENNQLNRTNCNSLESVLSDDSECTKSAPLEALFEAVKAKTLNANVTAINVPRTSKSNYEIENTSKSYGSSPNNPPFFGHYMYNNYFGESNSPRNTATNAAVASKPPEHKVYGFEIPTKDFCPNKSVTRSKSLYAPTSKQPSLPPKNIAYYFDGDNVQQYKQDKPYTNDNIPKHEDNIPRASALQHKCKAVKSLQSNTITKNRFEIEDNVGFESIDSRMVKSKSCSFDVVLEPASKPNPIKNLMEKRNSQVKKNLEKFEKQIIKNSRSKTVKKQSNSDKAKSVKPGNATKSLERGQKANNNKLEADFVTHKPPKPAKRTSSVKINNRHKEKSISSISSHYKAKLDGLQNKTYNTKADSANANICSDSQDPSERTFEVIIKEKDVNENKSEFQMDSLDVCPMRVHDKMKEISLDSLDILENDDFAKDSLDYFAEQDSKFKKDRENLTIKCKIQHQKIESKLLNEINPDYEEIEKYKSIERKLDIVNKLVEMEERKILQEKVLKELRMRPLKANIDDGKGVVKVLSKKFDNLATKRCSVPPNFVSVNLDEIESDFDNDDPNIKEIKRNLSLPDILDTDQMENQTGGVEDDTNYDSLDDNNLEADIQKRATNELNNSKPNEPPNKVQNPLKTRVYNEMVIPKTDVHLDSENYESSTTNSSCTNSPKRLSIYSFSRMRTPLIRKPFPRILTSRLCIDQRVGVPKYGANVPMSTPLKAFSSGTAVIGKRLPMQTVVAVKYNAITANRTKLSPYGAEEESGMRRAISLSDLAAKPVPAPRATTQGSPKTSASPSSVAVKSPSGFMRPAPRYSGKSNMTRSSSVGVLNNNQSDSESDPQPSRGGGRTGSGGQGLMRPTISSLNKAAANTARRRGLSNAYSTVCLSGAAQEESSSDAEDRGNGKLQRNEHGRRIGRSGSERELSTRAREVTARLTSAPTPRPQENVKRDSSGNVTQLSSQQLCSALTEQLTATASKVVQLYRSLQEGPDGASGDLVSGLEAAILETQKVLRGAAVKPNSPDADGVSGVGSPSQKLHEMLSKDSTAGPNPAMSLIEQYSDILLNMMQNKMTNHNQFATSPQSLPPTSKQSERDS